MKNILKTSLALLMVTLGLINALQSQSMEKPFRSMVVERQITAPAARVWEALVLDYGEISNFSPFVFTSAYEGGSLKGTVGAERKCNFNAKGTRWSHEQIREIDHENMRMINILLDAAKFPLNIDNSYAVYYVRDNGDGTSTAGYEFNFRTKPAFMGGLAQGAFKKSLNETLIGLEHYLVTGERVTGGSENASTVLKAYKSSGAYDDFTFRSEKRPGLSAR